MNKLVEIVNDKVVVSSRQIAESFGKEHKHVLDSIEKYIRAENSALTNWFYKTTYKAGTGKSYPMYLMTRDGFSLLVMGFTGEKALEWKIKYINAFNSMEKQLKEIQAPPVNDKQLEVDSINARCRLAEIWMKLGEKTNIPEYQQIINAYTSKALEGKMVLPLPVAERKTYSATEIGEKLGISKQKVGYLTNLHKLKTAEYGKLFYDKSPYSDKQVETFRYYDNIVEALKKLL